MKKTVKHLLKSVCDSKILDNKFTHRPQFRLGRKCKETRITK